MSQRNLSGDETTRRVLQISRPLYAEYGFDGLSLRMVAEASGINLGLITYYWGSKAAFLEALCEAPLQALFATRREAIEALDEEAEEEVHDMRALISAYVKPLSTPDGFMAARLRKRLSHDPAKEALRLYDKLCGPDDEMFAPRLRRACGHLDFEQFSLRISLFHGCLSAELEPDELRGDSLITALYGLMSAE